MCFIGSLGRLLATMLLAAAWPSPALAQAGGAQAFERDLLKSRFEHEVRFRAAAIQVAWGAEALCDHTTEIEPFVLWSLHAAGRRPSSAQAALLREATGMDEHWRVAWVDESMPDDVRVGDVVVAVNNRPLPASGTSFSLGNVFTGRSIVSGDDSGFWEVIGKAREESIDTSSMKLRLADGRTVEVPTQTGCAGLVTASAFDPDPAKFWREGKLRAKIPANAMLEDIIALITKHLKKGARIRLNGLGILVVRKRGPRMGRNPATGEAIKIKASKKVAFRASKELKEAI